MEKIALEVFHRHILVSHLKGNAARVVDRLEQLANQLGEPFGNLLSELVTSYDSKPEWKEDEWYGDEIAIDNCYFAHTDFRLYPVRKDMRIVDFLNEHRTIIESGCFPCSQYIRAPWSGPMLELLVSERELGKYYVLDGQLRLIWHWCHQIPNVKVYMYKGTRLI
jgi:hypothetical protein